MHPNVHCSIIYNSWDIETICINQHMNGLRSCSICIYRAILLSHKNKWKFAICNNTDGLGGCCTQWNKSEKENPMYYLYVEFKKENKLVNI